MRAEHSFDLTDHSPPTLVVVGDCLLDIDTDGEAHRLCPDAPVPVVEASRDRYRPGGAGLAALLAARAGHRVILVTAIGTDPAGQRLLGLLAAELTVVGLELAGETVCKRRIRAAQQSLLRVDSGTGRATGAVDRPAAEVLETAAAVLVSDYGRGTAELPEIRRLLAERIAAGVPVVWDPHPDGPPPVPGCTLVTPNAAEAGRLHDGPPAEAATALRQTWDSSAVAVTCGADGAVLAAADPPVRQIAAPHPVSTGDCCGAGDCFAAAAAGALAAGLALPEAVTTAVRTATRFVADGGANALASSQLAGVEPVTSNGGLTELEIARLRRDGRRLVAAGGCFDLLHPGHVNLLRQARQLGDVLVVCVNSDASVRRRKGPDRPILPVADRVRLLEALESVDAVAVFDQDTPAELLDRLRPDVWVKGGDYAGQQLPEADVVRRHGGEIVFVPLLDGYSSTRLANALSAAR